MHKIDVGRWNVFGVNIHHNTSCEHYSSPLDIVAIRFPCCDQYYSCYHCHEQIADHSPRRWSVDDFETEAILCGNCKQTFTIQCYLSCQFCCPYCRAKFNPGCRDHWAFYFDFVGD